MKEKTVALIETLKALMEPIDVANGELDEWLCEANHNDNTERIHQFYATLPTASCIEELIAQLEEEG